MAHHWTSIAPWVLPVIGAVGLCLGSFLNVVIHRLPRGESIVRPRSRCPRCRKAIAAFDNIPVLSYLLLRGRCRHCAEPISWRYPAVELASSAIALCSALLSAGPLQALVQMAFLLTMFTIALIDLDHRIIPDEISLPGTVLGVLVCPALGISRWEGIVGAAAGFGFLFLVATAYRRLRGIEGMGGGDLKLAGMLGAFLGWKGLVLTLVLGSLVGAVVGIGLIAARRGGGRTALPYGTFLAPAAGVVALAGARLWSWYAGLFASNPGGSW